LEIVNWQSLMNVKLPLSHVDKGISPVEMQEDMAQEPSQRWNRKMSDAGFPLPGLNDNFDFMGKQLHVQTESVEFPIACIVTQVFCKGKVILSRKTDCPPGARKNGDASYMRELMQAQHYRIMQNIANKQASMAHNRLL
jgi:hypothetical protein